MTQNELYSFFEQLKEPLRQYKENKEKRMDPGFNVFHLISDYYYRETFHGDIIAALLSPDEKHGEGNLYIDLFIKMINRKKQLVDKQYYVECKVAKEYSTNDGELAGRIDILIMGNEHCIVIENKLNNAPDTYRQLPKYYADLKDAGFTVDAFVYMPLDPSKEPNKLDWIDDEVQYIDGHLVIIPAYQNGDEVNLIKDWLIPAEEESVNEDAKFIIRQYNSLLNNLTINIMDNKEILDFLSNKENFETTISILDLKEQFCNKIKEEFIEKLKNKLEKELKYEFKRQGKDEIEIKNPAYSSWRFVIGRVPGNVNRWYRCLKYIGTEQFSIEHLLWPIEDKTSPLPLGWNYYGAENKDNEYKGFWDRLQTTLIMRNDTFADEIVGEIQEAFAEINRQNLPK